MRWALILPICGFLISYFTVTFLPVSTPTAASRFVKSAYTKEQIEYFLEVAITAEFSISKSASKIRKWQGDVNIQYFGSPTSEDLSSLNSVISELNALTNNQIHLRLVNGNPNIKIHFVPQSQFGRLEPNYQPGNSGYTWTQWDKNNRIYSANVLITTTKVTQKERSHLIREELTQSLGLTQDSYKYPDSIFYQPWTDVTQYSPIDKVLIKMLYDSRLTAGSTKSDIIKDFSS